MGWGDLAHDEDKSQLNKEEFKMFQSRVTTNSPPLSIRFHEGFPDKFRADIHCRCKVHSLRT